jgi:protein-disulfide isomerase
MDHLRRDYTSTIRFVWKDEPLSFHKNAEPAAELALEVRAEKGDAAYWTVHDKLYAAQPALETNDLLGIAKAMGLDENRASNALLTKKHAASIATDVKLAEAFRATGTPTFFINGRKVNGAQPYDVFTKVVDAELARARAKVASGTPQSKLYDELVGLQ